MWATGSTTGTPSSKNNAKYWSEESNRLGHEWADEASLRGEEWAEGTRNGQPVSAYSNKNAKHWADEAKNRIADTIDNMYFNLDIDTGILTAVFTDLDT